MSTYRLKLSMGIGIIVWSSIIGAVVFSIPYWMKAGFSLFTTLLGFFMFLLGVYFSRLQLVINPKEIIWQYPFIKERVSFASCEKIDILLPGNEFEQYSRKHKGMRFRRKGIAKTRQIENIESYENYKGLLSEIKAYNKGKVSEIKDKK